METEKTHVIYILECKDGSLYTGYTNNLSRRLAMHEAGKAAKYTKGRGPFHLCYYQVFETKQQAMRAEYQMKQLNREQKIKHIQAFKQREESYEDSKKL